MVVTSHVEDRCHFKCLQKMRLCFSFESKSCRVGSEAGNRATEYTVMSDPSVTTAGGPLLQIFLQSNNKEHTLGGNAAPPMLLIGGQQTSSVKGQMGRTFGFAHHRGSLAATQLCHHSTEAAIHDA